MKFLVAELTTMGRGGAKSKVVTGKERRAMNKIRREAEEAERMRRQEEEKLKAANKEKQRLGEELRMKKEKKEEKRKELERIIVENALKDVMRYYMQHALGERCIIVDPTMGKSDIAKEYMRKKWIAHEFIQYHMREGDVITMNLINLEGRSYTEKARTFMMRGIYKMMQAGEIKMDSC